MTSPAPAGWYGDPAVSTQLRYWDGATWTEHVAPGHDHPSSHAPRGRLHPAALVGIIVGGVFVAIMVVGVLAAIAIPVFISQQGKAHDAAARADASSIGVALSQATVDAPFEYFTVEPSADGTAYVISSVEGEISRTQASPGVVLEYALVDPEAAWFCVQTHAPEGSVGPVHYDAWYGLADGPCQ